MQRCSMSSRVPAANGLYAHSPDENIWRRATPSNWAPHSATTHQDSANQGMYLRPNQYTATKPRQPTLEDIFYGRLMAIEDSLMLVSSEPVSLAGVKAEMAKLEIQVSENTALEWAYNHVKVSCMLAIELEAAVAPTVIPSTPAGGTQHTGAWGDNDIVETSTTVDEAETTAQRSLQRTLGDVTWKDEEVMETSTTIDEAERTVGRALRRAVGDGRPTTHQRTSSGSTQSSTSLESLATRDDEDVGLQTRTRADVAATQEAGIRATEVAVKLANALVTIWLARNYL
ncbi:uncharacterized protein B0H18DRAFT_963832 [Fomitopsis serialis]|uniref:uncharacterized protein n=1 Tax=Fomitopsis serialis TaxID=139415 RepID=UPI0020073EE3|nr:uncharacterized protein B0H18DRAFT_963832 [Neoantrodia serialis]KAH9910139.1 hypothetical protein B0H18DRAFT_963832 [Neoantrodia serialis]